MRLATLRDDSADGTLAVVSTDLETLLPLPGRTLQGALDEWERAEPELRAVAERLDRRPGEGVPVADSSLHSPLPRAFLWADASTYTCHMERIRGARGMELPPDHGRNPAVYQSGADSCLAPEEPIPLADESWGLDLEATVAIVTGRVPAGTRGGEAGGHVRLLCLTNDLTLRNVLPREYATGVGFFQSKPARAYAPFAVTPDELGAAWSDGLLHATLDVRVNGELLGRLDPGEDCAFDFHRLIAHLALTRPLAPGSIIGSGTVSNRDPERGFGCLMEKRAAEVSADGEASTPLLAHGDRVRIEALDADGRTIFGALDQVVDSA